MWHCGIASVSSDCLRVRAMACGGEASIRWFLRVTSAVNTRLAFLQVESQRLHRVSEAVSPSRNYPSLEQIIREFARVF